MAMTIAYISLLVIVGIGRLAELVISRRNQRQLEKQGVRKIHEPLFRLLVLLHGSILVCAGLEVLFLHRPLIPALAISMGIVFILSNVLRWWVIWTMAGHWNVEVMDSTRVGVVSSGPFRWVRHPNYVGVVLEVFSLPMMHTAWITAIIGTLGYMEILRHRLKLENGALMGNPEYRLIMGGKPSFFPRIFGKATKGPTSERTRAGL
ncbi:MAG TPA: isoprenylcysteine carboxylmethyltransferase family protein [Candidatus Acidoferrales bacterium]|jgi:methyltransferase|nr:isoprenylcysteine carboxylmethyltransferase family protein [Candidatus Acidoferrales bacterium]